MRSAAVLSIWIALAACAGTACGTDTTTGRTVRLRTRVTADAEIDAAFETESGFNVRLTRAFLSLGALYYFDGGPAFARRRPLPLSQQLAAWLRPSVAFAHPGHYVAGSARGQMIVPSALDLSAEWTSLPDGEGVSGTYRSGRVVLAGAGGAADLDDSVALLEGTATKDETTVHFRVSASLGDLARSVSKGEVSGCVFEPADVERDGTIELHVKPSVWLSFVDFAEVEPGSVEAPTEIERGDTPQVAFALGVAQLRAYRFYYTADAE